MAECELFGLTGLPFDPPEKAGKKVKEEIKKKIAELGTALGKETQPLAREKINGELTFLKQCLGEGAAEDSVFDGAKLNALYTKLAQARTDKELAILKATVEFQKQAGTRVVTNGTIRAQVRKTRLSKENVEKVYNETGFTISTVDPNKAYPKFPTNADKTYSELEALRKSKDPNPQGHDLNMAVELYAFIAYLCSKLESAAENPAEYKTKSTSELRSILDGFARPLSQRTDPLGKLCASIASAGKSYVFNSDENRAAYDKYLLYRSSQMENIFTVIKAVSVSDKYDLKFAESCIKQISAVFGEYDVALAIYNKEAGIEYIPEKAIFHVKCPYCQNLSEFADVNEAKAANKCTHCEKALYKQCSKCKKSVLVSHDKCPECSFVFASTAMFAKFCAAVEQALRRSDFEEARNNLFQAKSADPSEETRIAELEAQISSVEEKFKKPINDLRQLIAQRKFDEASKVLADTIRNFPSLNVASFDSQIKAVINSARTTFTNAKKLPLSKQVDICLEILNECVDFKPAIDFLRVTPPESCKNFSIGLDPVGCNTNLNWSRSTEQGVTYRVLRKHGKNAPVNEMDGEIVLDKSSEISYCDSEIQPGKSYSYAVFAVRYGVFSKSINKTIVLLADVTELRFEQIDTTIRLTWNNPKNCTGVTIYKIVEGVTTKLIQNAHGSYEDKGVKYGIPYIYKLCANYNGLPSSNGVDLIVIPMIKIDSFTIKAEQVKNNNYKVYWEIKRNGIDLRILIDERQVRETKSDSRFCEVLVPPNGFHTISAQAYSGGSWLRSSNDVQINTYTPCSIDKDTSHLSEKSILDGAYSITFHMKIREPIPDNVVGFYYAIRTKKIASEDAPWVDKKEIEIAHDIREIGLAAYESRNEIVCTETARKEDSYYVSLFTIYNFNGNEIISNVTKCRFDRPLLADLFWKVHKTLVGGYKLTVEIIANRPFERVPELVLCSSDKHMLSYSDPKGRKLQTFAETRNKTFSTIYQETHDLNKTVAQQLKKQNLFLFEVTPVSNESYTRRWIKGFNGKV